jgi:hypothetical protein
MTPTETSQRPRQRSARRTARGRTKTTGQTNAAKRRNGEIRDGGRRFIKAYETTWDRIASYEDKVADKSKVDWVTDILRAQARVTRKVSRAYGSEARKLIGSP